MSRILRHLAFLAGVVLVCASLVARASSIEIDGAADLAKVEDCLAQAGEFSEFLQLWEASGFRNIMARYIESQPVTLLVPSNAAFARLSMSVRTRLTGSTLVKVLENTILLENFPFNYLTHTADTAFFDTVLGTSLYRMPGAAPDALAMATSRDASPWEVATVTGLDTCGQRTFAVHVVDHVLIPESMLSNPAR